MKEPNFYISPAFKGTLLIDDLLKTEATIMFTIDSSSIKHGGWIFLIENIKDFTFGASFQNDSIVIQRNDVVSVLELKELLDESDRITQPRHIGQLGYDGAAF